MIERCTGCTEKGDKTLKLECLSFSKGVGGVCFEKRSTSWAFAFFFLNYAAISKNMSVILTTSPATVHDSESTQQQ